MLIDWFTVAAQIVNFLVLLALLKRFLFGPVVKLIDEREKRIAGRIAEAEEKKIAAEREMEKVRSDAAEQQQQCQAMVAEARRTAEEEHQAILVKARESVRSLEQKWHDDLELEKRVFLSDLRKRAASEVVSVARRALDDLAGSDVQHASVEAFIEKLRKLDPASLKELASCNGAPHALTILSPEIPEDGQQRGIRSVLESRLNAPVELLFCKEPSMAWGIELRGDGRRIGWTPESYMDALEEQLDKVFEKGAEPVHQL